MTTSNEHPGLTVTHPYADPADARYQCKECGAWAPTHDSSRGVIRHSKRCDSQPQAVDFATAGSIKPVQQAQQTQPGDLRSFARSVRATSTTKGRDADVLAAVRRGHLSINDAMNTDD